MKLKNILNFWALAALMIASAIAQPSTPGTVSTSTVLSDGTGIDSAPKRTAFKTALQISSADVTDATTDGATNPEKLLKSDAAGRVTGLFGNTSIQYNASTGVVQKWDDYSSSFYSAADFSTDTLSSIVSGTPTTSVDWERRALVDTDGSAVVEWGLNPHPTYFYRGVETQPGTGYTTNGAASYHPHGTNTPADFGYRTENGPAYCPYGAYTPNPITSSGFQSGDPNSPTASPHPYGVDIPTSSYGYTNNGNAAFFPAGVDHVGTGYIRSDNGFVGRSYSAAGFPSGIGTVAGTTTIDAENSKLVGVAGELFDRSTAAKFPSGISDSAAAVAINPNTRKLYDEYGSIVLDFNSGGYLSTKDSDGYGLTYGRDYIYMNHYSNSGGSYWQELKFEWSQGSTNSVAWIPAGITGNIFVQRKEIDTTSGSITNNGTTGRVQFAAGASSIVVTADKVTADSIIVATVATNDATMKSVAVVAGAGSFTLHANAAATGITKVNFFVTY